MDKVEIERRRVELRVMLLDLSKSQVILQTRKEKSDIYKKLEHIYYYKGGNFRHFYSDIYAVLSIIDKDPDLGDINILAQNLEILNSGYTSQNEDEDGNIINISDEIAKLYDHVNLDAARFSSTKEIGDKNKKELENINKFVTDMKSNYTKISETIPDIKSMQKEYITILGIFASIVLSFTSGMAYSTSIFANIEKASIYRILIITLIVGIVLITLVWLLMDFIKSINGNTHRKVGYVIIPIALLLVLLVLSCISYGFGWFDREIEITSKYNIEISTE